MPEGSTAYRGSELKHTSCYGPLSMCVYRFGRIIAPPAKTSSRNDRDQRDWERRSMGSCQSRWISSWLLQPIHINHPLDLDFLSAEGRCLWTSPNGHKIQEIDSFRACLADTEIASGHLPAGPVRISAEASLLRFCMSETPNPYSDTSFRLTENYKNRTCELNKDKGSDIED